MTARGRDEPWLAAETLPAELGRAWARAHTAWHGAGRTPVPRGEEKPDLALVTTPLGPVVAKRERGATWKRALARLGARTTRSERGFALARELRARGLATPEPLAVLGRPGAQVLVTRYVAGHGPWELLRALGTAEPLRGSQVAAEPLLDVLATELARLHAAGFRHRDLQAANLHLARDAEGALTLHWTDLEGLRRVGTVEGHLRARDLARLAASFESRAARAAGIRAHHWPALVERYLARALARPPRRDELESLLVRTHAWAARAVRRHLVSGRAVH